MELHEIESTLADIQETLEREHAVLEAKISDEYRHARTM